MKLKININKKNFLSVIVGLIILIGIFAVYAFGTSSPSVFGHTGDEIANISLTFVVPIAELRTYNPLANETCLPSWPGDTATKFATASTISACSRYCQAKGYDSGTFVECDGGLGLAVRCACIQ